SNMKVSSNLLLRLARGEILTRREKQLLELTVADSIRLVPFIVIAIVPFLEFSLPFLLKIFPNMLPSTYTTKDQQKNNLNASL
ncbi:LETM1 domain-containing protein, partial [Vibrio cholerae]|uniref:LETM1 domain-containing protein n=1 Tax=Vibrio cholerae TaxID=666 RepID=UPI0018F0E82A